MEDGVIARALELARIQHERLASSDFEAYAENLPEYVRACEQVSNLPDEGLRAGRPELASLVEIDHALGQALTGLQDKLLDRMGSLRRSERVAAAYFAAPALSARVKRSA